MLANSLKWIVGGAAAGALAALLVWLVGADEGVARSRAKPERVEATEGAALRDELARADATNDVRIAARAESAALPVIDSTFGVVLVGRVVDESGAPIAGAGVTLTGQGAVGAEQATTVSGSWSHFDLVPGEYEIVARAQGFYTENETLVVEATGTHAHSTVLVRAPAIPVRIEDTSGAAHDFTRARRTPLDRVGIAVTRERPASTVATAGERQQNGGPCATWTPRDNFRDIAGRSAFPAGVPERFNGLVILRERAPLWISLTYGNAVVEARPLSGDESEIVFVCDLDALTAMHASVRVRVVSELTGELLTSGVSLSPPGGGRGGGSAEIDGDALVFRNVPPGRFDLAAGGKDVERIERIVDVPPRGDVDLGTIVLGPRGSFVVNVVDESGSTDSVWYLTSGRPAMCGGIELVARAGTYTQVPPSGVVTIEMHALGETLILAGGSSGRARVGVLVDTRATNPVELRVPSGVEIAFDFASEPPDDATIVVENSVGVPLHSGRSGSMSLAPGVHTLVVRAGHRELVRQPFTVGSTSAVITVEVPR